MYFSALIMNRKTLGSIFNHCCDKLGSWCLFLHSNKKLTFWDHFWSSTSPKSKSGLKFCTNLNLAKLKLIFGGKWILRCGVAVAAIMAIMAPNGPKMAQNGNCFFWPCLCLRKPLWVFWHILYHFWCKIGPLVTILLSNLPKVIFFIFGLK